MNFTVDTPIQKWILVFARKVYLVITEAKTYRWCSLQKPIYEVFEDYLRERVKYSDLDEDDIQFLINRFKEEVRTNIKPEHFVNFVNQYSNWNQIK